MLVRAVRVRVSDPLPLRHSASGETRVFIPRELPRCGYTSGCAGTHEIEVSAIAAAGANCSLRLVLLRNFHRTRNFYQQSTHQPGAEITGISAMWIERGAPSGRSVQVRGEGRPQHGEGREERRLGVAPLPATVGGKQRSH